jgi:hypothetical protein
VLLKRHNNRESVSKKKTRLNQQAETCLKSLDAQNKRKRRNRFQPGPGQLIMRNKKKITTKIVVVARQEQKQNIQSEVKLRHC